MYLEVVRYVLCAQPLKNACFLVPIAVPRFPPTIDPHTPPPRTEPHVPHVPHIPHEAEPHNLHPPPDYLIRGPHPRAL